MSSNRNCYLIADEVGLGKTKIAAGIIEGIRRNTGRARVMYVASNARIAAKNIDELEKFDPAELKEFQKKTVNQALENLGYDIHAKEKYQTVQIPENKRPDRLSMYDEKIKKLEDIRQDSSFVLSFSPTTSFLQPAKSTNVNSSDYSGDKKERKQMALNFASLQDKLSKKKQNDVIPELTEEQLFQSLNPLETALIYAIRYELEMDNLQQKKNKKVLLTTALLYEKVDKLIEQLPPIDKVKYVDKDNKFCKIRRIICNANAILFNPDVIVLDEIQRFRATLEWCADGYSVIQLIHFLNQYRGKSNPVKVIMLSATPYNFDHGALASVWEPKDEKSAQEENPYEDFEALKKMLDYYGAATEAGGAYYSRTERRKYYTEKERKLFAQPQEIAASPVQYKEHIKYLSALYTEEKDDPYIGKWNEAPQFWRFSQGLKNHTDIQKKRLEYEAQIKEQTGIHLQFSALCHNALPEGAEHLLWTAPTIFLGNSPEEDERQKDKVFGTLDKFGKTIVFSHYRAVAKSAAALLSEEAEERLIKKVGEQVLADVSFSRESEPYKNIVACLGEEVCSEKAGKILNSLSDFFNYPYAKKAIFAVMGKFDEEAVEAYCQYGQFASVMAEYRGVYNNKNDEEFAELLCDVLSFQGGKYDNDKSKGKAYSMGIYYTDDVNEKVDHDKKYEKTMAARFNSPFYPFVLSVTAKAQEGLDFHYYADKIMHWQPAVNVNAFQQREGRIDRPMSITIRRRYAELMKPKQNEIDVREFFAGIREPKNAEAAFKKLSPKLQEKVQEAKEDGIFPMWYIPLVSEESAKISRIIIASPFSREYEAFKKLLEGSQKYAEAFKEAQGEKEK